MAFAVMKSPRTFDLEITGACNLRCAYCSHFSSPGDVKNDLPAHEWLDFFSELGAEAVMSVTLSGGEPFLRTDIQELIAGIVANRMRFSILTNGTLISNEMAAFIASTGRCDMVQVSIDGAVPISHDAFRGEGNFAKAIGGLRLLQRYRIPCAVRVTIHRKNVYELEKVAGLLLEDLGLPAFSTNSAGYMGLCRKNTEQVQLTASEHSLAMETLLKLTDRYPGQITASAGPLADARTWVDMETARQEKRATMSGRGRLTACNGPMKTLAVQADGTITPCLHLGHIALGRINRDAVSAIWQQHPSLQVLRQRFQIPLDRFDFCRDCPYIPYCTGNCPATAYTITGEVNHPSPDACLRLYKAQGGRLPDPGKLEAQV